MPEESNHVAVDVTPLESHGTTGPKGAYLDVLSGDSIVCADGCGSGAKLSSKVHWGDGTPMVFGACIGIEQVGGWGVTSPQIGKALHSGKDWAPEW